jgi:hypothetical protein
MGNERQLPVLYVVESGPSDFQRWMISDDPDRLWSGQEFGQNGVLYARHNDAAVDAQNILRGHFGGIQSVKYVVPLFVESLNHQPLPVAEVAQYLSRASRLFVNTSEHGNGPGDSLVLPWIEWSLIKEVKGFPHE